MTQTRQHRVTEMAHDRIRLGDLFTVSDVLIPADFKMRPLPSKWTVPPRYAHLLQRDPLIHVAVRAVNLFQTQLLLHRGVAAVTVDMGMSHLDDLETITALAAFCDRHRDDPPGLVCDAGHTLMCEMQPRGEYAAPGRYWYCNVCLKHRPTGPGPEECGPRFHCSKDAYDVCLDCALKALKERGVFP